MRLDIYQVDAFADKVFEGNPAAVIPLNDWLPEETIQKIALENNLSETAFFISTGKGFHIRWFTPGAEVDLCGHATLATAHVLYNHLNYDGKQIIFDSKSGILKIEREEDLIILDFPSSRLETIATPENLFEAFNIKPRMCIKGRDDLMLVFENEEDIKNLKPDFQKLIKAKTRGIVVTSQSNEYDFVSRFFAPAVGINEDPVTGSAHTMLIPFWAKKLNKTQLLARQISKRSGVLHCTYLGQRVKIGGRAVTFLVGEVII